MTSPLLSEADLWGLHGQSQSGPTTARGFKR